MINEADILVNNEVKVTSPQSYFTGSQGIVKAVMADGRTLDVELNHTKQRIFIDVTLVSEIQEPYNWPEGEPDLGPIANSVMQGGK